MGRLVPWAKYTAEWRDIRDERKRPRAAESAGTSSLFGLRHLSSLMSFSRMPRPYCDQTQSLLFKLPPEVREVIWAHAVGNHELTIVRKMTKLGHVVLPRDKEKLEMAERVPTDNSWIRLAGGEKRYKTREVLAEESLLPLLQTSKRVYQEALPVLYSHNDFDFQTVEGLHRFLRRSPTVGIQSMLHLQLSWCGFYYWPRYERYQGENPLEHNESWAEICASITEMGDLRELRIEGWGKMRRDDRVYDLPDLVDFNTLVEIVAPLRSLPERVDFQFIIRGRATFAQRYQDRLHAEGYTNVRLIGSGVSNGWDVDDSE